MKSQIELLRDYVDLAATDYIEWRLKKNELLTEKDAKAFEHLMSAKKQLSWALEILEEQDVSTD